MSPVSPLRLVHSNNASTRLKNPCQKTSLSSSRPTTSCDCVLNPCDLLASLTHSLQVLIAHRPEQAAGLVTLASTLARAAAKVCVLFLII
jgi:hypothetical protein